MKISISSSSSRSNDRPDSASRKTPTSKTTGTKAWGRMAWMGTVATDKSTDLVCPATGKALPSFLKQLGIFLTEINRLTTHFEAKLTLSDTVEAKVKFIGSSRAYFFTALIVCDYHTLIHFSTRSTSGAWNPCSCTPRFHCVE